VPVAAFQFIAVAEPRLTARLVRQSAGLDATLVLDLEDALWDIDDEARTAQLKAQGRRDFQALTITDPGLFADQRVGVRVNRLNGVHAAADLEALGEVARRLTLECVVVTKVESGADLDAWLAELDRHRVTHRGLVPIVETVAGLANLAVILARAAELGIEWVVYGHYDHALDAGWWPFLELDSTDFWQLAQPIIEQVEGHGLRYVQPPFFQLHRPDRFAHVLTSLTRACRLSAGAITLGRQQTALAVEFDGSPIAPGSPDAGAARAITSEELARRARHIVDTYSANRRATASFAIDGRSGEFISPHLYLAAQHYLGTLALDDGDAFNATGE